jgi:hypothetical protein
MTAWSPGQHALDYVAKLNSESYLGHNDWRLPNMKELRSLVDYGQADLVSYFQNGGFSNVRADFYWTSTSNMIDGGKVGIAMYDGGHFIGTASDHHFVWPVQGGQ